MPFFPGLIGGFTEAASADRVEQQRIAERRQDREAAIFELLVRSDNEDISSTALAGLLEQAQKPPGPGKGIFALFNDLSERDNPTLQKLRQMVSEAGQTREVLGPDVEVPFPPQQFPAGDAAQIEGTGTVDVVGAPPPGPPPGPTRITGPVGAVAATPVTQPTMRTEQVTPPVFNPPLSLEEEAFQRRAGFHRANAQFGPPPGGTQGQLQQGSFAMFLNEAGEVQQVRTIFSPDFGDLFRDPATGGLVPVPAEAQFFPAGSASFGNDLEAESQLQFQRPFFALRDPAQIAAVIGGAEDREAAQATRVAGGTAEASVRGRTRGELDAPISDTVAISQGLPFGVLNRELQGITPVTAEQRERVDAAKALMPDLVRMEELIPLVFPLAGGFTGGVEAAGGLMLAAMQRSSDFAALQSVAKAAIGNIARVRNAETGRLTEQDVLRAERTIVRLEASLLTGDTRESALARMEETRVAMQRVIDALSLPAEQLEQRRRDAGTPPPDAGVDPNTVTILPPDR